MSEGLLRLARDVDPETRRALIEPSEPSEPAADADPLHAAARLRREHPEWSADFTAAVATQRELRSRARAAGTVPERPWLLTRTGLEQSTRPEVALRRAHRIREAGVASVVDLTAGLGVDAWACTRVGMRVVAIESDPLTAELCRANVPEATVVEGTAQDAAARHVEAIADLPGPVCWFVDPARRGRSQRPDGSRAAPERDPQRWSPPWSFVESLLERGHMVAAKAPGGFTPDERWSAEWVGVGEHVAECAVYALPGPAPDHPRQATLLGGEHALTFPVTDDPAPVGGLDDYLAEPHPVFHRALPALCAQGWHAVHERSTWLSAPAPSGEGARWYRVLASAPLRLLRAEALRLGIPAVAVKSKESPAKLEVLRRQIRLPDGNRYAIVFAHGLDDPILVERLLTQSG